MYWGGVYVFYYSVTCKINVNKHDFFLNVFLCNLQEFLQPYRHFIHSQRKNPGYFV